MRHWNLACPARHDCGSLNWPLRACSGKKTRAVHLGAIHGSRRRAPAVPVASALAMDGERWLLFCGDPPRAARLPPAPRSALHNIAVNRAPAHRPATRHRPRCCSIPPGGPGGAGTQACRLLSLLFSPPG